MKDWVQFPNHLAKARGALGLTPEEVAEASDVPARFYAEIETGRLLPSFPELERIRATLGGLEPAELYAYSLVNTIGDRRFWQDKPDYKRFFESMAEGARLLVAPDEMLWLDRDATPDREVDVFFNMSCSTQFVPHLMLDSASALRALGVSFASGSGPQYCCGTYYRRTGRFEGGDHMNAASVKRSVAWGAKTAVHMCTQCVNTFTEISRRQAYDDGIEQGVDHTQLLRFVDEWLEELGDRVPWKKTLDAKVLVHGHSTYSFVHDKAKRDVAAIARRIPGVEVVGTLDRISIDSFCDSEPGVPKRARPKTREEVEAYRAELRDVAASWGANVISPSHQTCLQMWLPYWSEQVRVRHPMSLLAEALGVGHPDRYAAASRLGDTAAIVEQTRPVWSKWGMPEDKARATARAMFDPAFAVGDLCGCGKNAADRCGHPDQGLISIDVLAGEATVPVSA
jgi:Fe-S oxidoreductase